MRNRHGNGKFAPGEGTGAYRGRMKHDASTESIKDALHTVPSRAPVVAHEGTQSVNTDSGVKPIAHPTSGPNAAANAAYNKAAQHSARPAGSASTAQIVGSGIKLN